MIQIPALINAEFWLANLPFAAASKPSLFFLLFVVFLMLLSYYDIKYRRIPASMLQVGAGLLIIYSILVYKNFFIFAGSLAVFAFMWLAMYIVKNLSRQRPIAVADIAVCALAFLVIPSFLIIMQAVMLSLIMLLAVAIVARLIRRQHKEYPFIPFILIALVLAVAF